MKVTVFDIANTPDLEELLDRQVGDAGEATELGQKLQNNLGRYKRLPRLEADRERRIRARLTVDRALEFLKKEAWNARRDWARARLASKSDGKDFAIPKPNVEELINEIDKQKELTLRDIIFG